MKAMIPKQHGAWAMLLIPFYSAWSREYGFLAYSALSGLAVPLLDGLSRFSRFEKKQLQPYQKWIWYYGFPMLLLIISVFHKPQLVWIGVFIAAVSHTYALCPPKNERALTNDIAGVLFFCSGGLASCWLGTESLTAGLGFYSCNPLYFCREFFLCEIGHKGEKNRRFAYWSWGYHLLLPFYLLLGAGWAFLAFIPSSLRYWFFMEETGR